MVSIVAGRAGIGFLSTTLCLTYAGNDDDDLLWCITFMRKNVIEVSRSTVDFRSINFSWEEAGKLLRYMDKSIRSEL